MLKAVSRINNSLNISLPIAILVEVISGLQIIQLIFQTIYQNTIHSRLVLTALHRNIAFIAGAFETTQIQLVDSLIAFGWSISVIYLGLHILLVIYILSKVCREQKLQQLFSKFLGISYLVHSRVIFFLIQTFLYVLVNEYKNNKYSMKRIFHNDYIWLTITTMSLAVNFTLAIISELCLYQTTSNPRHSLSVKMNLYHQTTVIYKALMLLLNVFEQSSIALPQVTSSLHILFSLVLLQILYSKLPFVNFKVLKTLIIITSIIFSTSVIALIHSCTSNTDLINGLQFFLMFLPILVSKLILTAFRSLFERIVRGKFRSPEHAIHFALLMDEIAADDAHSSIMDRTFFPDIQTFNGILAKHNIDLLSLTTKKLLKNCDKQLFTYVIDKLEHVLHLNPKSQMLLLFMAQIYTNKLDNIIRAFELVKRLETLNLSLSIRSSIDDFYFEIESTYGRYLSHLDNRLELTRYFQSVKITESLKETMLQEIQRHISFWIEVKNNEINVRGVLKDAEGIERLFLRVQNQYQRNSELFQQSFALPFLMYAVYLNNVRKISREGAQMYKKFQVQLDNQIVKSNFSTDSGNTVIIIISLDKRRLGEILHASGPIHNIFFISKNSLIGKNFGCLFPTLVAKSYQTRVEQYLKCPNYKLDEQYNTFGKTANGELFEMNAQFCLYSYLSKEITIMVTLRRTSNPKSSFIANHEGTIVDISHSLQESFSKESLSLKSLKSMQDMSSDFDLINMAFNIIYSDEQLESMGMGPESIMDRKETVIDTFKTFRSETRPLLNSTLNNFRTLVSGNRDEDSPSLPPVATGRPKRDKVFPSRTLSKTISYIYQNPRTKMESEITSGQAHEICEDFVGGKQIVLSNTTHNINRKKRRLTAKVQIKPFVLEGEVLKVVTVGEMKTEIKPLVKVPDYIQRRFGKIHQINETKENDNNSTSKFADDFPEAKEVSIDSRQEFSEEEEDIVDLMDDMNGFYDRDNKVPRMLTITPLDKRIEAIKKRPVNYSVSKLDQGGPASSAKSLTSRESKTTRALKGVFLGKKLKPLIRVFLMAVYIDIFCMITISAANSYLSRKSIQEISTSINIVNTATQRLAYAIKTWQFTLFLYSASTGLAVYPSALIQTFKTAILYDAEKLIESNNQLKEALAILTEADFLNDSFDNNVKLWGLVDEAPHDYMETNTFIAHDILATKYMEYSTFDNLTTFAQMNGLLTVLNNTGNDFILSNKRIIERTEVFLDHVISNCITLLKIVLIFESLALVCLCAIFVVIVMLVIKSYKRLFNTLGSINETSINTRINQLNRVKTLLEADIEARPFIQNAFDTFMDFNPNDQEIQVKTGSVPFKNRKVFMRRMIVYLFKITGIAIFFLPVLGGLFGNELIGSIRSFQTLSKVSNQLSILNQARYQADLFVGAFAFDCDFLERSDMLVYNKNPEVQMMASLNDLKSQDGRLTRIFLNQDGSDIDPVVESILKDGVCRFIGQEYQADCAKATKNINNGLLSVISDYVENAMNSLDKLRTFKKSYQPGSSKSGLRSIATPLIASVTPDLTVIKNIYPVFIEYILGNFNSLKEQALQKELALSIMLYIF